LRKYLQPVAFLVLAVVAAASMWFYVIGILRAHQIADAEAKQIPRGNLSDLYPRWLGARELLLHHRNPYSRELTLEIQESYYGRRLDPARANDPKDQQGFAYPVYVVFLLAPLIGLRFATLQIIFYWLLAVLTGMSVWLWLRVLRWHLPAIMVAACVTLTLGSFPAVQGIRLQQLSLLVAALLAGAVACAARGWLLAGGMLLALATIKPQLTWLLVAWLLWWAMSDWRTRRKLVVGFAAVMALLLVGAEIVLPGWWHMFVQGVRQYQQYTQNQSVLEVMLDQILGTSLGAALGHAGGEILAGIAVLACVPILWNLRHAPSGALGFGRATTLVLALSVLVVPMYAPYNQILLLPAIFLLVQSKDTFLGRSRGARLAYFAGAFVVGYQWVASVVLLFGYFLFSRAWALKAWTAPLFCSLALPILVFALTLLEFQAARQGPRLQVSSATID